MACDPRSPGRLMESVVSLRDVDSDDIPVFFEHQIDAEACEMAGFPSRTWDAFTTHWAKILDDPTTFNRTILVDGQVAGNIASFVQDGERDIGYWLGRAYWGRGIATEALRQFLTIEQRRPLSAYTASDNVASRRVLEKCGFTMVDEGDEEVRFALLM
jgi:RimJ/RimL family protein N-acetyltransferase